MKKKLFALVGVLLVAIVGLLVWYFGFNIEDGHINEDAIKFKEEYEAYNEKTSLTGKTYQTLNISKDSKIKYITMEEASEIIENGTGMIYFGFPNCPWCRGMIPILLDVIDCSCSDYLYYVDMTDKRDTYELLDGKPNKVKDAEESYYKLLELLDSELDDYTLQNGNKEVSIGEKRIYVPLVVAVKDGKVLKSQEAISLDENQSPYDELKKTQKDELKSIFENMIELITKNDAVCEEHC